jgi:GT2 family glycosyltransferase
VQANYRDKNNGFTGGVNPGIELAIAEQATYVAPFNNDAIADKHWLARLVAFLESHDDYGVAACQLLHADGKTIDSTADQYTVWGLPYPRGRDEPANGQYDDMSEIFGASGGASMYRVSVLKKVGIFDQDFFAYYEDIDLSFRIQLAGWKVGFAPTAVVYHQQGATSTRLGKNSRKPKGANTFTTQQYMRNLPMVLVKDVPFRLALRVAPRFMLAYSIFFVKAMTEGRGVAAWKGLIGFWMLLPKKLRERRAIQKNRVVSDAYIWGLFLHDLPPNALKIKRLRSVWWRLTGRSARS